MQIRQIAFTMVALTATVVAATAQNSAPPAARTALPRTADGKPNFSGIWQAASTAAGDLQDHAARVDMRAGLSVVEGGQIPYLPAAAAQRAENFKNRGKADPLAQCFMPGIPRVMYLDFPFQIFQTPQIIAMTFEWSVIYRQIYTDGSKHPEDLDFWMGDSRGRWEGDTLVVDVTDFNDKTWFDLAGDYHSDALHVVERYHMTDADTIEYEATIEDAKTFSKPWTIRLPLKRRPGNERLMEYGCESEKEEANGAFERQPRTWYPGDGPSPVASGPASPWSAPAAALKPAPSTGAPAAATILRTADGKPNLQGFYRTNGGGANYGLGVHPRDPYGFLPAGRGVIVDPSDGKLPLLPWAADETANRFKPENGYDDPTAHCFVAGVPRSMYVPAPLQIIQTSDYVVFLHERMAWRIVDLKRNTHIPDTIRLWQGDSIGRWEGDTLVIDTTNFTGKTWLNEVGEFVSYAEHTVERFTPTSPDNINYEATVTDPVVYSRPWTIAFPVQRQKGGVLEIACLEDNQDLAHLKAIRDNAAAKKK